MILDGPTFVDLPVGSEREWNKEEDQQHRNNKNKQIKKKYRK